MFSIKQQFLLLVFLMLFFSCGNDTIEEANSPEEILRLIEQKFDDLTANNQFHGAVLIAKDGIPIFENAYGTDRTSVPNTIFQPFNIASIGKMFTGVAIVHLVQKGQLKLEDTIHDHLPNYGKEADAKRITIHHLLTHSSGIPDIFSFDRIKEIETADINSWYDYFPYFEMDKLEFKPGKKWSYSNSGYLVLGKIIEVVSGETYCEYLTKNIFTIAEMDIANCNAPMGGSKVSMQDLLKFSEALLQNRLLNEAMTDLGLEAHIKVDKDLYYGYGFELVKEHKSLEVSHRGGDKYIKGQLLMFPETGYTVIIYGNNNDIGYDGFNEARHYLRSILT